MLLPVILAGGSGTRLWPVSRDTLPKQLARLVGEQSLLEQTARRLLARALPEHLITVGAKAQDFLVRRELAGIGARLGRHRLLEPVGRNTAAAIALAALYARDRIAAEALLWVCPSDHLIHDPDALYGALDAALPVAEAGELVTFGITPTRAETGYGYIQAGAPLAAAPGVLRVARFVEKPPRAAAEAMVADGGHYWNSGMFLFRAERILAELSAHAPAILAAVEDAFGALAEAPGGAFEIPLARYEAVPAEPIDKAVMERAARIAVVPCDPGWSDLGSWQALWEQLPKDGAGNATQGDVVLDATANCLVHAEGRLVACSGVEDLAVVATDDAILVAGRSRGDGVRQLVSLLKAAGRPEASAHGTEQRPWGSFRVLHEGPGWKVKEIIVTPGGRLSLQSHRHRAEHWVVVAGTARVTVDEQVLLLEPNQGVRIPLGARHRMENPGAVPMHLIEVQCGSYLGEDDIIRYEDVYGRS
ncbi:MAG TPA: mannose-1-phosphate guanylyltransferase/mannose-6-phosphate isomerase [Geminicoccaceae bacterium]|nr:mannose-1-phosphate guanylyltransferase/mannose-6-phosphate isomerase [Geminicoccaceae bacterium]